MEQERFLKLVAKYYQCNLYLAERIVKSAELNHTISDLQKTIKESFYGEIK